MPRGTTAATRVPAGHGAWFEHMATPQRSSAGEAQARDGGVQTDRLAFQASWPIRRRRPRVPRSQAWTVREGALQGVCNAEQQWCEGWHFT